ncbi:MAG: glycosyltransferase [Gammaproteobacteria bacterium]
MADDDYVELPIGEGIKFRDALTLGHLAMELRRRRGEIALVHFYSTKLVLLGPLIAAFAGVPSIVTVTGFGRLFSDDLPHYRIARTIYWVIFRATVSLARRVLFQNRGDLETTVVRLPMLAEKARYIGSASSIPISSDPAAVTDRLQVIHVARLLPSKGIADFVRVAEALHDQADFILVGGPSNDYPAMLRLVTDAHARGVLTYLGRLDPDTLTEVYDSVHVILFPSYGEGMARVMLEAGLRGLCPVAYDIPANRDLVLNGNGFLLPLGDTDGACRTIARLVRDRELLTTTAKAYHEHVVQEFTMEPFAKRLDAILSEVIQ